MTPSSSSARRPALDVLWLIVSALVAIAVAAGIDIALDKFNIAANWRDYTLINAILIIIAFWYTRKYLVNLRLKLIFVGWVGLHLIAYIQLARADFKPFGYLVVFLPEVSVLVFVLAALRARSNE